MFILEVLIYSKKQRSSSCENFISMEVISACSFSAKIRGTPVATETEADFLLTQLKRKFWKYILK